MVTFLIALILAPLILLTIGFALELFTGLAPLRQEAPSRTEATRAVIVVPAHDEAANLESSLSALAAAAQGRANILLVADNCTDSTADIARRVGVSVVERVDAERRGKGFALDFARERLAAAPPEVVVIVDADCWTDSQSLERLIAHCVDTGRPTQAVYLQTAVPEGPPTLQLSTFAFFIKNLVRQRAQQRLAGRVHLLGTGMALPWPLFKRVTLATSNIVEDLEMGLELAEAGHSPLLAEAASVWSDPASARDTIDQRRRWEGGYLESAAKWAPRVFVRSLARAEPRALWSAINLLIPPVTLLVLLDLAALVLAALAARLTGASPWPPFVLAGSMVVAAIALVLVATRGGSHFITLRGLALIPVYLMWKIPLYLGLARRGAPKQWVRTRRG